MAFYRCGGGGIPSSLKTDMNAVLNKKFGTSADYPPADWAPTVNLMGPLPEGTATGSIAHITDGADEVPIKSWQVEIAPTLTGKSAIECTQTRKNLANGLYEYNTRNMIISPVFLRGGTVYTVSFTRGVNVQYIYIRKGDTVSLVGDAYATGSNATSFSFTADEDAYYYAQLYRTNTSATWTDYTVSNPQIEVGSTATAYEPYTAPTVSTVNLGRTIYGGTADVVNGTGTENYGHIDLGSLTWTKRNTSSGHWRFTTQDIPIIINDDNSHVPDIASVDYTAISPTQSYNGITGITCNTNISQLMVCDESYSDASAFSTAMSGKYIVYPLIEASRTDFTFTPITPTPETALGVNNFWSDSGDTEVTYRADINLALGGQ